MTLTLVQMRPDMGQLLRVATREKVVPDNGPDDLGYALHAILKAGFGEHAPKPFALVDPPRRRDRQDAAAQILGYTEAPVDALRQHAAAFAAPEIAEALGLTEFATKAMPDRFPPGARLGFRVRVRPTVRRDRDGDRTKTREHDAYLAAVEPYPAGTAPFTRGEVYGDWLRRQFAGAADVERATLDAFRLTRTLRRDGARDLRLIPGPRAAKTMGGAAGHPDATFTGTLAVRDPDAFAALLARGVGRHRAFGFGMLLLRPPE